MNENNKLFFSRFVPDRMIASEHLSGVPLLVLANKQDIPDCMGVHTVKPIFNQNAHLIGARDIMLMAISALTGYIYFLCMPCQNDYFA